MIFRQAATIESKSVVLSFKHIVLHLFNYLSFKPL